MTMIAPSDLPGGEVREDLDQFQRNSEFAESHWDEFLKEHEGEWVVIFDEQQTLFDHDVRELLSRIPSEHRDTAVLLFLERAPAALFL